MGKMFSIMIPIQSDYFDQKHLHSQELCDEKQKWSEPMETRTNKGMEYKLTFTITYEFFIFVIVIFVNL